MGSEMSCLEIDCDFASRSKLGGIYYDLKLISFSSSYGATEGTSSIFINLKQKLNIFLMNKVISILYRYAFLRNVPLYLLSSFFSFNRYSNVGAALPA